MASIIRSTPMATQHPRHSGHGSLPASVPRAVGIPPRIRLPSNRRDPVYSVAEALVDTDIARAYPQLADSGLAVARRIAKNFHAELGELPVAARLRHVITVRMTDIGQLRGLSHRAVPDPVPSYIV